MNDFTELAEQAEITKFEHFGLMARVEELESALRYFTNRVEAGTARSKVTYDMYKKLLNEGNQPFSRHQEKG